MSTATDSTTHEALQEDREPALTPSRLDGLEVFLGLGADGLALGVSPGAVPADLDPWLLDLCAIEIEDLGHRDQMPQPRDWEHLLPLLQPGEELLWVVDYVRGAARPFTLRLALKANAGAVTTPASLRQREERFRALTSGLTRQAFPGSAARRMQPEEAWALVAGESRGPTWCVTGIPAQKDAEAGPTGDSTEPGSPAPQSLNDVVEAFLHVPAFRLTFVVGRCESGFLADEFDRVTQLRNHVHPLVLRQVADAEQRASSWQNQTSESTQEGQSRVESDSIWQRVSRGLATLVAGSRESSRWAGFTWEEAPSTRNEGRGSSRSTGTGGQFSSGRTTTREVLDSALQLVDESLERYADNLYAARASGAYRAACFIQAPESVAPVVASAVRGVLSGSGSRVRPVEAFVIRGPADDLFRSNAPTLGFLHPAAPILTDQQAARLLLLPEAELPGLRLQRNALLGRNAAPRGGALSRADRVELGHFAFADDAGLGSQVLLHRTDLFRHLLVCGTTGSGKTRRVLSILNRLPEDDDLRILVIETAKRTYRGALCRDPSNPPRVYTVGESTVAPLRINPFYFEPGTSLKRHVSVLADALAELLPTEALIGPKLREAVERVYLGLGWDIETGTWMGGGAPTYPSPVGFVAAVRQVAEALHYGKEVTANYRGALEGRARVFLDATFQDIFSHDGDRAIDDLFDRDTIIEMEGLPGSEIDVPAFLLALLLERLRSHQLRQPGRRWLVVIEEAHNVLPRAAEEGRSGRESDGAHTLVKNLTRLLQEGREMGIGVVVIDQAPTLLARSVLKNANTKIVMRLEDAEETAEMGQALGLEEDDWSDLGTLRPGEAIIKAPYMAHPVRSSPYAKLELDFPEPKRPPLRTSGPNYAGLERSWRAALLGEGPPPDESWWAALRDLAADRGGAVRFGLGRALLVLDQASGHPEARELLTRLDSLPPNRETLLPLAQTRHARARAARSVPGLRAVAAILVAVEAGLPRPEGPCPAGAVSSAVQVLHRSGGPAAMEDWSMVISALALPGDRWRRRTAPVWERLRAADAAFGPALRLMVAAARLGHSPVDRVARRGPADPLALLQAAGTWVDGCLAGVSGLDAPTRERLVSGVARGILHMHQPAEARRLQLWLEDEWT